MMKVFGENECLPKNSEIKALISLLSETEIRNLDLIRERLVDLKQVAIPFLTEALSNSNSKIQIEAAALLEEIRVDDLYQRWVAFCSKDEVDLEEGAFLFSEYAFPSHNFESCRFTLKHWADEIRVLLESDRLDTKKYQVVLDFLFQGLGFSGNRDHYHEPENSYLPAVIESKKGLPITLSLIVLLIAKRLNLPFYPVGMPGHFIVKYVGEGESIFVDPFNGGKIISKEECITFLTNSGYGFREEYLQVTGNRAILERMLRNLNSVYSRQGNEHGVKVMTRLADILHTA